LGVVGAGAIARQHVEGLTDARVAAVCDVDGDAAARLAAPWGAATYPGWEAMLEHDGLDAVLVATPPAAHREPAVAALERGLAVYLEKPIARTLEDGEAI